MDAFITAWFVLLVLSLAYVSWHNIFHNPVSWVQKLAWILVTAYTGVVGLVAYLLTCRTRKGKSHDESTKMTWQQGVNSEIHCVAGDATGIIVSAAIVFPLGLPNGVDLIIEYCSAFVVGLFIFQALMMIEMYQGNYLLAVKKTIFVETVSMNFIMMGMIPVMLLMMNVMADGDNPLSLNFWFIMGMATIAGSILAYPVNYWFVSRGLKHGCMTVGMDMGTHSHHGHARALSLPVQLAWVAATFIALFIVIALTATVVPISF